MRRAPSLAEQERRKRVWRHNSFFGYVRMMQVQLSTIISAETPTLEAKKSAADMLNISYNLQAQLKERPLVDRKMIPAP